MEEWKEGLSPCGVYYEGFTDDLQQTLTKHSAATLTTYGIRRSHICVNHVTKTDDDEMEEKNSETQKLKVANEIIKMVHQLHAALIICRFQSYTGRRQKVAGM